MRTNHDARMGRVDRRMDVWSVTQPRVELRRVGVKVIRRSRLKWYGHVEQKDKGGLGERLYKVGSAGDNSLSVGQKDWQNSCRPTCLLGIDSRDARDLSGGGKLQGRPTQQCLETPPLNDNDD